MTTLQVTGLAKTYGPVLAVDHLSFAASAGQVTGFLGPNGSGKTTTMRILLGLADPTSGTATFDGRRYADLRRPIHQVGAVIAADTFHPGRTGANHLRVMAIAAGIAARRVGDVLDMVGLSDAAGRRVGGYSMGMRQRLSLAAALLGDPGVLILDEPLNGLDPEGILWTRGILRRFAREGRTVFLSSHLLSEISLTVDTVVVITAGRLVADGPLDTLGGERVTVVRTPQAQALATALLASGHHARLAAADEIEVSGLAPDAVGRIAAAEGVVVVGLAERVDDLEQTFRKLTTDHEVEATS